MHVTRESERPLGWTKSSHKNSFCFRVEREHDNWNLGVGVKRYLKLSVSVMTVTIGLCSSLSSLLSGAFLSIHHLKYHFLVNSNLFIIIYIVYCIKQDVNSDNSTVKLIKHLNIFLFVMFRSTSQDIFPDLILFSYEFRIFTLFVWQDIYLFDLIS